MVDAAKDATFARLEALIAACDATPCTNGEAGVALMMFFARIDARDDRFLPIVLGAFGYDKRGETEPVVASLGPGEFFVSQAARPSEAPPPAGGEPGREA